MLYNEGSYEITGFQLTNRYEYEKIRSIEKFIPDTVLSVIYRDGNSKNCFVLKDSKIETSSVGKRFVFISEEPGSKLLGVTSSPQPVAVVAYRIGR